MREKKEAGKSRARFWEVAGSKMGKVTGAAPRLQHPTTAAVLYVMQLQLDGCQVRAVGPPQPRPVRTASNRFGQTI